MMNEYDYLWFWFFNFFFMAMWTVIENVQFVYILLCVCFFVRTVLFGW